MVSDKQIRLAGGGLAVGFGLAIALAIVSLVSQTTALLISDTFIGRAPGADYLNQIMQILDDQAALIQSLSLVRIVSIILIVFGILTLERAMRDGTAGGFLRGIAALVSVIAVTILIIVVGFDLVSVHVLALAEASDIEPDMQLAMHHAAEALTLAAMGMASMAALVGLLGSAALHLGLSSRTMFRHSSTISLIVGIVSVIALLLLVVANYIPSAVIQLYAVANILGMIPRAWLFFVGVMMWRKGDEVLGDG